MVVVQYQCQGCHRFFSYVDVLKQKHTDRRELMCPFCESRDLLFLERETFASPYTYIIKGDEKP